MPHWQTTRFALDLHSPLVMGIVNTTPDSFSDGSPERSAKGAIAHAQQLLQEGAHILDIGGESTRPGAPAVSLQEELRRVLPVLQEVLRWNVPVSIDTYKPQVMQAALDLGVDIVNDIWGLRQPGAMQAISAHPRCGVCIMHMHRTPQTMQQAHMDGDAVPEVQLFLHTQSQALMQQGVKPERIVWDYGIGFGKTVAQNFSLLARQRELLALNFPLLAGWSRKGSLGQVSGRSVQQRMVPSVAAALLAVERGARIVRVHDVADTVAALAVWQAMHNNDASPT